MIDIKSSLSHELSRAVCSNGRMDHRTGKDCRRRCAFGSQSQLHSRMAIMYVRCYEGAQFVVHLRGDESVALRLPGAPTALILRHGGASLQCFRVSHNNAMPSSNRGRSGDHSGMRMPSRCSASSHCRRRWCRRRRCNENVTVSERCRPYTDIAAPLHVQHRIDAVLGQCTTALSSAQAAAIRSIARCPLLPVGVALLRAEWIVALNSRCGRCYLRLC